MRQHYYRKGNKYQASKTVVDGIVFDSKREAVRWTKLLKMQEAGLIENLRRQVEYTLLPAQKDDLGHCIERSVKYIADFEYWDKKADQKVVEDTKGFRTADYVIKRKLMLWIHGIQIREV